MMATEQANSNKTAAPVQGYHPVTRWLHAALVLGVMFQIFAASMMAHPEHQHGKAEAGHSTQQPQAMSHQAEAEHGHAAHDEKQVMMKPEHDEHANSPWSASLMEAHRAVGFGVVFIVFANLIWAILRRGEAKKRQIGVLFSKQHWSEAFAIAGKLPWMLLGKQPLAAPGNALALIVEMLGLLTMTAMASTGLLIWILWSGLGQAVFPLTELLMQTHSAIAALLYMYLAGHVTMALLHARSGDSVFSRIIPLARSK